MSRSVVKPGPAALADPDADPARSAWLDGLEMSVHLRTLSLDPPSKFWVIVFSTC
jgi:hypothetical protein